MEVEYLIIGQGISGTWLSYYLQKTGRLFLVIDNANSLSASRLAAGIINPVTGRRHVQVWMAKQVLPFTQQAYQQLGKELNITAISEKKIVDFFPSPQMRVSFMQRVDEQAEFVFTSPEENIHRKSFNYDFGCGEIKPVYIAHLETLLPVWRSFLSGKSLLVEDHFEQSLLQISDDGIRYKDISARKIIFCDGPAATNNPLFEMLPFAPNKGELLILSIPGLPKEMIYKKGMMLAPLATPDHWWIGSSYEWDFVHADPTAVFRERATLLLKQWLKIPFTIEDHLAGIRPATLERRPFVGIHPLYPSVGILNGMGTKGCSLAPFFAKQLADHLVEGTTIDPEADIQRFRKILSRKK